MSRQDDGARRFIALVDECYDRGIPLWLEAEVPPDELYQGGALAFPFRRTLSRLREIQLARFGGRVRPGGIIGKGPWRGSTTPGRYRKR
ncbi:AFG1/ZapE family ATPase [Zobellella sp. DQSA1]|uniref:AFG1/ZapE family ATPase n=1 Tax=Zobellella sp. DQSA1 TaxID=3342386 RepID=UPI0035C140C3